MTDDNMTDDNMVIDVEWVDVSAPIGRAPSGATVYRRLIGGARNRGASRCQGRRDRMEHAGKIGRDRRYKLDYDKDAIKRPFVHLLLDDHSADVSGHPKRRPDEPPSHLLDLNLTDDPLFALVGALPGR